MRSGPLMTTEITAFFVSAGGLSFAELGDKTQLLAIMLAARYRKPVPIILGIFAATLLNNIVVAALGQFITDYVNGEVLHWIVGLSLIFVAWWMLIPEKTGKARVRDTFGVFGTALISFFFAELADKTQFATMALAAKFPTSYWAVVAGSVFGMMLVNIPAVLMGERATKILPMRLVNVIAASIYGALGLFTLVHDVVLPGSTLG